MTYNSLVPYLDHLKYTNIISSCWAHTFGSNIECFSLMKTQVNNNQDNLCIGMTFILEKFYHPFLLYQIWPEDRVYDINIMYSVQNTDYARVMWKYLVEKFKLYKVDSVEMIGDPKEGMTLSISNNFEIEWS